MTKELLFDLRDKRVYVAEHQGMMGSAIVRRLANERCEILMADGHTLDLTNHKLRRMAFADEARCNCFGCRTGRGSSETATIRPTSLRDNLAIALSHSRSPHSRREEASGTRVFFCVYPEIATQPMTEDALLAGSLESTIAYHSFVDSRDPVSNASSVMG